MQEEEEEGISGIIKYNGHWAVQSSVVGLAIILLIIIIAYLHFDEDITNFFSNSRKMFKSNVKKIRTRIRRRYLIMTGQAKQSIFNPQMAAKIRAIGQISLAFSHKNNEIREINSNKKSVMYPLDEEGVVTISVIAKPDGGQIKR